MNRELLLPGDCMTKPELSVTQPDGSRKYVHPLTGEKVSSVTTIIKGGVPQPWMGPWAAKQAGEYACANWYRLSKLPHSERIAEMKQAHIDYANERGELGDIVHDIVECWGAGKPYPDPPKEVRSYVDRFIDFLVEKKPRFIENEVTLWSHTYGYAGTADFIIEIDGRILLADLKTGKSLHSEIGLQLSALAGCDVILRENGEEHSIPRIDGLAGLHLRPRSWKLVEIQESDACFSAFLSAQAILKWTTEIAPGVLP
jgi:hypothetical protein